MNESEKVDELIALFNSTFESFNTRLVKGDNEPIYLPRTKQIDFHRIVFANGFFASALHEIAHWCLAGDVRRQQVDYGYWYEPDGRNAKQQAEFEHVEIKPQAIEWGFCLASGRPFRVSTDNLNGVPPNTEKFTQAVKHQLMEYLQEGFPPRAQTFIRSLQTQYQITDVFSALLTEGLS